MCFENIFELFVKVSFFLNDFLSLKLVLEFEYWV